MVLGDNSGLIVLFTTSSHKKVNLLKFFIFTTFIYVQRKTFLVYTMLDLTLETSTLKLISYILH